MQAGYDKFLVHAEGVTHSQENGKIKDTLDNLYNVDFVAWLEAVAAQVRAGNFEAINTEHLAEELGALAKQQKNEAAWLTIQILRNLLKLDLWNAVTEGTRRHWASELGDEMTKSVRNDLAANLPSLYERAAGLYSKVITREVDPRKGGAKQPPKSCPYTLEQVLDDDFYSTYTPVCKE
ncbi:hypothetical protein WJX72_007368 [[Myrmecia] bisecta]|uniref:Uncharacterized protein n=1 Tax=[Myrmecia] bisecta TaxID=41462 RepID=A0AAW1PXU4_9CHLO